MIRRNRQDTTADYSAKARRRLSLNLPVASTELLKCKRPDRLAIRQAMTKGKRPDRLAIRHATAKKQTPGSAGDPPRDGQKANARIG
jgi:DNA primase